MSRRDPNVEDDARLQDVLAEASQLDGDARRAYLDRECAGDPALRAEVQSLLGAVDADPAFMADPTVVADATESTPSRADHPVPRDAIAGYVLEREVSRGGQGVVYLASQPSTGKQVAVK